MVIAKLQLGLLKPMSKEQFKKLYKVIPDKFSQITRGEEQKQEASRDQVEGGYVGRQRSEEEFKFKKP